MTAVLYRCCAVGLVGVIGGVWAEEGCSYVNFRHQDVGDAAQHRHKVEHVPGVLQVVL